MSLEEDMRESILRAVLKRPKECPFKLVRAARDLQIIQGQKRFAYRLGYQGEKSWQANIAWAEARFMKQVIKHSDKLPGILGEDNAE